MRKFVRVMDYFTTCFKNSFKNYQNKQKTMKQASLEPRDLKSRDFSKSQIEDF